MDYSTEDFLKDLENFLEENEDKLENVEEFILERSSWLDQDILDIDDVPTFGPDDNLEETPGSASTSPSMSGTSEEPPVRESMAPTTHQSGSVGPLPPSPDTSRSTSTTQLPQQPRNLNEKQYEITTIEGKVFKISYEQMNSIPFAHIRKSKRRRFNVFLSKGESVRLKIRKNKLIWSGYKKKTENH